MAIQFADQVFTERAVAESYEFEGMIRIGITKMTSKIGFGGWNTPGMGFTSLPPPLPSGS